MTQDLLELTDRVEKSLSAGDFDGYGPRPIPDRLDNLVANFVVAFYSGDGESQTVLCESLSEGATSVLSAFAERMSILAVRNKSTREVGLGIRALVVALQTSDDARNALMVMAVLWDAIHRLERDSGQVFRGTEAALGAKLAEPFIRFAQRDAKDQALKCMGFKAGSDEQGFRYHWVG